MAASIRRWPTAPMRKYGLDVTILQGGPQSNNRLLLAAGRIDFDMGANMIQAFDSVAQNVPIVAVAAMFQKDPFILMSHPNAGYDHFADLPKATAYRRQRRARHRLSMAEADLWLSAKTT